MRGKHSPGFTLRGLARENNPQGNQIRRYIKSLPELRRLVHKKGGNSTKHSGRPMSLANANELCEWVVNLRREGMPISVNMAILRASQMDERFRREKMQTKYSVVNFFKVTVLSSAQKHTRLNDTQKRWWMRRNILYLVSLHYWLPRTVINGTLLIWIKHQFSFQWSLTKLVILQERDPLM